MSKGQEQVVVTLALCQEIARAIEDLTMVDGDWKSAQLAKVRDVAELLEACKDRFFLRSKLCLPFAAKCGRGAAEVLAALERRKAGGDDQAAQRAGEALHGLLRAARALDERSAAISNKS